MSSIQGVNASVAKPQATPQKVKAETKETPKVERNESQHKAKEAKPPQAAPSGVGSKVNLTA